MSHPEGEPEPVLSLTVNGERQIDMHRGNTTMYTFAGRTALGDMVIENSSVNHIFVTTGQTESGPSGMYFFEEFSNGYADMAEFCVEHSFPMILHMRRIPECDLRAWLDRVDATTASFKAQIPNAVPEDLA